MEKLDTRGLALSLAATAGLMYLVGAILVAIVPTASQQYIASYLSLVGIDATGAFTFGAFIIGLIVALVVGAIVGAVISALYNAFAFGEQREYETRRHSTPAHHAR